MDNQIEVQENGLIKVSQLIRTTFYFIIKHWKELLFLTGLPIGLQELYNYGTLTVTPLIKYAHSPIVVLYILVTILLSLTLSVFSIYVVIVTVKYIGNALDGTKSLRMAFKGGFHRFFSFIWAVILVETCLFGSFIFFVIPGIIISVYLMAVVFLIVEDKYKGLSALAASYQLVKGRWWNVFGRILLLAIMNLIFISLAVFVFIGLDYMTAHTSQSLFQFGLIHLEIVAMAITIASWLYSVFSISYFYIFYRSLLQVGNRSLVETDLRKPKDFFMGLSIWGVVSFFLFVLLFVFLFFIGTLYAVTHTSNNALTSNSANSSVVSSSTLVLSKIPYVNNDAGYQLLIPKGWIVENKNKNDPTFVDVYDPMFHSASHLTIVANKENLSIDYFKQSTQDNLIKLLAQSIVKSGGTIIQTNRVSSTTVDLLYRQSGPSQPISLINVYFLKHRLYQVAKKIETVDSSWVSDILSQSVDSFQIIPKSSQSTGPIGFVPPFTNLYTSSTVNFSVKYPATNDWVWTKSDLGSQGVIFSDNDLQSFNSDSANPHARIVISDQQIGQISDPQSVMQNQINLILSSYKNSAQINRNVTSIRPSIPNGVTYEVFEVKGGAATMQGGTMTTESGLFMVAVDGQDIYVFDFRSDSEDFMNFYPLASSMLKTFTISK